MQNGKGIPAIFISYAWGSESEAIAESIEKEFQKRELPIIRDKNDLGYKGRIKDFMEQIGRSKYVILVISNKYLRSVNCMFELVQIFKNQHFYERIFPVVLDEVKIAKASDRLDLMKYWENEAESLSNEIKQLKDLSNIQGLTDDLNLNTEIRNNIARLTKILKDTNTLNTTELISSDFEQLYNAVQKKIRSDGGHKGQETKVLQRVMLGIILLLVAFGIYRVITNDGRLDEKKKTIDSTAIVEKRNDSLRILAEKITADSLKKKESNEQKTDTEISNVRYNVELVVPSSMAQADVFVDGKSAEVIERSLISITVRLRKKGSSHHFEIVDGYKRCSTDRLIEESNIKLTLCD